MADSKAVVLAALVANGAIAILKFGGFLLTGSPAMLSETYHSISDTGNQVFLLVGIKFGAQDATQRHPFGYGKAQFFYSFLVAVLLFGIAGWESLKHGYGALLEAGAHAGGHPVTVAGVTFAPVYVNYAVLAGAFVFECYALYKANAGLTAQMDERGWSGYLEAFKKTSDVTTLTAFTEDTIALVGIVLAFAGNLLTQITGLAVFDAASAALIGVMLMGFALALAWQNKRLILGESLPPDRERKLRDLIEENAEVAEVLDLRTVYFGPERVLLTADVSMADGLSTDEIESLVDALESDLFAADDHIRSVFIEPET